MLREITETKYFHFFGKNQHPFISKEFISLNRHKAEDVVYLTEDIDKPSVGLIAGIKEHALLAPFSAPFGGFHYRNEQVYISETEKFVMYLKEYMSLNNHEKIHITFPPSIYGTTANSKMISSMIRNGFKTEIPDITNYIDLNAFSGKFSQRNSREYLQQAIRSGLRFSELKENKSRLQVYNLIVENRKRFNRPIFMSFEDIENTGKLWPVDYYGVFDLNGELLAGGIFYRFSMDIVYALFWGDNELGRPKRAMDFLSFNLWNLYKESGKKWIDLGISTENGGIPNEGLLRFKETHEAVSELRFRLSWNI